MTTAGELRHRIAFDKRGTGDDGYGNPDTGFSEQFVVSAKVQAKFGGEAVTAARLTGQQPVIIVVRQSTNTLLIKPEWRARDVREGTEYAIRSVVDPDDGGMWLEMLCQTGVAT